MSHQSHTYQNRHKYFNLERLQKSGKQHFITSLPLLPLLIINLNIGQVLAVDLGHNHIYDISLLVLIQ